MSEVRKQRVEGQGDPSTKTSVPRLAARLPTHQSFTPRMSNMHAQDPLEWNVTVDQIEILQNDLGNRSLPPWNDQRFESTDAPGSCDHACNRPPSVCLFLQIHFSCSTSGEFPASLVALILIVIIVITVTQFPSIQPRFGLDFVCSALNPS